MYKNLNKIGLKGWIDVACGGASIEDKWLRGLDTYLSKLSSINITVLKSKFSKKLTHLQKNDLLHELEVACAFHPQSKFLKENETHPDLFDTTTNTYIEVKSLNEGLDEQTRHLQNSYISIDAVLSEKIKNKLKNETLSIINKKALFHSDKASEQLTNKGIIYLVWDYNKLIDGYPGIISTIDVSHLFKNFVTVFSKDHFKIKIIPIYFAELRNHVARSSS
ncbi:MAG: hypothetical protein WC794_02330 [Candidatus Doudnabacteria bacterium]|jgi:hypothetical protein